MPTYGIIQSSTSAGYAYSLKGGIGGNVPVFDVSWGDAARFVNWLQNGQPNSPEGPGTTETGSYDINGGSSNAALMLVTRSSSATWVLPTLNEWYKSAYYVGGGTNAGYWLYPTRSDDVPTNVISSTGTNNANFMDSDPLNLLTPVGTFAASPGPYGTYDEGGDVEQWNETDFGGIGRGLGGGSFAGGAGDFISTTTNENLSPMFEDKSIGFRVASVPEPGTIWLLLAAAPVISAYIIFFNSAREYQNRTWVALSSRVFSARTSQRVNNLPRKF
jgi:hypothetical protein